MRIRNHTHRAFWFVIPFAVVMGVFTGARLYFAASPTTPARQEGAIAAHPLLGQTISSDYLIAPRTGKAEQEWSMPDSAVVVLLDGTGCSGDQVAMLRRWSNLPPESECQEYPVVAILAEPIVGEEAGMYETLVLRRVSQAQFPFIVSQGSWFSPRNSGVRTPLVVLTESGVITQVMEQMPGLVLRQVEITK
ncbi:MAG: hypothetical protein OXU68_06855 [Bacteroidota bacterium]|nr:hypothetical protein [Bacteroidota bacterium]